MVVDSRVRVSRGSFLVGVAGAGDVGGAALHLHEVEGILGALCEALFGARLLTDTSLF